MPPLAETSVHVGRSQKTRGARSFRRTWISALAVLLGACGRDLEGPTPGSPVFDGDLALELVVRQVDFGPRVPGSEGHARQLAWMRARLDSLAPEVTTDSFEHVTLSGDTLSLTNVLARFRPEAERRILLLAHWDTRPRSDQAADSTLHDVPVPGANDGASGTAVLLHLAALFSSDPPPMGIDLLFVDGEDYGPTPDDMFLGARRYAETLASGPKPVYGVLLDMVGDADPLFPIEGYSAQYARVVTRKIRDAAARLGLEAVFPDRVGEPVGDDHVPLIEAGLRTANIIDFDYGPGHAYWHTPEDTPDKLSAETLRMVGQVVTELVYSGG